MSLRTRLYRGRAAVCFAGRRLEGGRGQGCAHRGDKKVRHGSAAVWHVTKPYHRLLGRRGNEMRPPPERCRVSCDPTMLCVGV